MAPHAGATLRLAIGGLLLAAAQPAYPVEFRSVGPAAAILYDAPSLKAHRLYLLNQGYPVEIVVALEGWYKVRDAAGGLAWMEAKDLTSRRMVLIKVPRADVHKAPDENAPVAFRADQDVLLEVLETRDNWAHVKHSDGDTGYVRITQVWGL